MSDLNWKKYLNKPMPPPKKNMPDIPKSSSWKVYLKDTIAEEENEKYQDKSWGKYLYDGRVDNESRKIQEMEQARKEKEQKALNYSFSNPYNDGTLIDAPVSQLQGYVEDPNYYMHNDIARLTENIKEGFSNKAKFLEKTNKDALFRKKGTTGTSSRGNAGKYYSELINQIEPDYVKKEKKSNFTLFHLFDYAIRTPSVAIETMIEGGSPKEIATEAVNSAISLFNPDSKYDKYRPETKGYVYQWELFLQNLLNSKNEKVKNFMEKILDPYSSAMYANDIKYYEYMKKRASKSDKANEEFQKYKDKMTDEQLRYHEKKLTDEEYKNLRDRNVKALGWVGDVYLDPSRFIDLGISKNLKLLTGGSKKLESIGSVSDAKKIMKELYPGLEGKELQNAGEYLFRKANKEAGRIIGDSRGGVKAFGKQLLKPETVAKVGDLKPIKATNKVLSDLFYGAGDIPLSKIAGNATDAFVGGKYQEITKAIKKDPKNAMKFVAFRDFIKRSENLKSMKDSDILDFANKIQETLVSDSMNKQAIKWLETQKYDPEAGVDVLVEKIKNPEFQKRLQQLTDSNLRWAKNLDKQMEDIHKQLEPIAKEFGMDSQQYLDKVKELEDIKKIYAKEVDIAEVKAITTFNFQEALNKAGVKTKLDITDVRKMTLDDMLNTVSKELGLPVGDKKVITQAQKIKAIADQVKSNIDNSFGVYGKYLASGKSAFDLDDLANIKPLEVDGVKLNDKQTIVYQFAEKIGDKRLAKDISLLSEDALEVEMMILEEKQKVLKKYKSLGINKTASDLPNNFSDLISEKEKLDNRIWKEKEKEARKSAKTDASSDEKVMKKIASEAKKEEIKSIQRERDFHRKIGSKHYKKGSKRKYKHKSLTDAQIDSLWWLEDKAGVKRTPKDRMMKMDNYMYQQQREYIEDLLGVDAIQEANKNTGMAYIEDALFGKGTGLPGDEGYLGIDTGRANLGRVDKGTTYVSSGLETPGIENTYKQVMSSKSKVNKFSTKLYTPDNESYQNLIKKTQDMKKYGWLPEEIKDRVDYVSEKIDLKILNDPDGRAAVAELWDDIIKLEEDLKNSPVSKEMQGYLNYLRKKIPAGVVDDYFYDNLANPQNMLDAERSRHYLEKLKKSVTTKASKQDIDKAISTSRSMFYKNVDPKTLELTESLKVAKKNKEKLDSLKVKLEKNDKKIKNLLKVDGLEDFKTEEEIREAIDYFESKVSKELNKNVPNKGFIKEQNEMIDMFEDYNAALKEKKRIEKQISGLQESVDSAGKNFENIHKKIDKNKSLNKELRELESKVYYGNKKISDIKKKILATESELKKTELDFKAGKVSQKDLNTAKANRNSAKRELKNLQESIAKKQKRIDDMFKNQSDLIGTKKIKDYLSKEDYKKVTNLQNRIQIVLERANSLGLTEYDAKRLRQVTLDYMNNPSPDATFHIPALTNQKITSYLKGESNYNVIREIIEDNAKGVNPLSKTIKDSVPLKKAMPSNPLKEVAKTTDKTVSSAEAAVEQTKTIQKQISPEAAITSTKQTKKAIKAQVKAEKAALNSIAGNVGKFNENSLPSTVKVKNKLYGKSGKVEGFVLSTPRGNFQISYNADPKVAKKAIDEIYKMPKINNISKDTTFVILDGSYLTNGKNLAAGTIVDKKVVVLFDENIVANNVKNMRSVLSHEMGHLTKGNSVYIDSLISNELKNLSQDQAKYLSDALENSGMPQFALNASTNIKNGIISSYPLQFAGKDAADEHMAELVSLMFHKDKKVRDAVEMCLPETTSAMWDIIGSTPNKNIRTVFSREYALVDEITQKTTELKKLVNDFKVNDLRNKEAKIRRDLKTVAERLSNEQAQIDYLKKVSGLPETFDKIRHNKIDVLDEVADEKIRKILKEIRDEFNRMGIDEGIITQQDLDELIYTHYVPHMLNEKLKKDKKAVGLYKKLYGVDLTKDALNPFNIHSLTRKDNRTIEAINAAMKENHNIDNFFETNLATIYLNRGITHNKVMYQQDQADAFIKTFGTKIKKFKEVGNSKSFAKHRAEIKKLLDSGDAMIVEIGGKKESVRAGITSVESVKKGENIWKNVKNADILKEEMSEEMAKRMAMLDFNEPYTIIKSSDINIEKVLKHTSGDYYVVPKAALEVYTQTSANQLIKDRKSVGALVDNILTNIYDPALSLFKRYAVMSPGFHKTNIIGNIFNSYVSVGAEILDPEINWNAIKLRAATSESTNVLGKMSLRATKNSKVMGKTVQEWNKILREYGVIASGQFGSMKSETVLKGKASVGQRLNPLGRKFFLSEANQAVGSAIEEQARIANFLIHIKNGKTNQEAADLVNKFLFDYADLTQFETKVMKRIVPFYTFMRKNAPLQLEQLFEVPQRYANLWRLEKSFRKPGESPLEKALRPEYLEGATFTGRDDKGNPNYYDIRTPLKETFELTNPKDIISAFSPIIKAPIEAYLNKDFYFGSEIEKFDGQKVDAPGYIRALGKAIPGLIANTPEGKKMSPKLKHMLKNIVPTLEQWSNVIEYGISPVSKYEPDEKTQSKALKFMTGGGRYSVDIENAKKYEFKNYIKQLEAIERQLRSEGFLK